MQPSTSVLVEDLKVSASKVSPGNFARYHLLLIRAEDDYYHEYVGELTAPISQLINDLVECGLYELSENACNGKYDASLEESNSWLQNVGKHLFT